MAYFVHCSFIFALLRSAPLGVSLRCFRFFSDIFLFWEGFNTQHNQGYLNGIFYYFLIGHSLLGCIDWQCICRMHTQRMGTLNLPYFVSFEDSSHNRFHFDRFDLIVGECILPLCLTFSSYIFFFKFYFRIFWCDLKKQSSVQCNWDDQKVFLALYSFTWWNWNLLLDNLSVAICIRDSKKSTYLFVILNRLKIEKKMTV